jgi:hypothetical protein
MSQLGDGAGVAMASDMDAITATVIPKILLNCIFVILDKGRGLRCGVLPPKLLYIICSMMSKCVSKILYGI